PEQVPHSPDYVSGLEHVDDEIVVEDQPYAEDASPTAQSPNYVSESDPKADPKEDDDEDPEEDPVDHPVDGGDDGDNKDEPSKEDEDDDVNIKADEDEDEEEHPAPADSIVVALPTANQALSAEETEPFETDESAATPPPHHAYRMTARISIPAPVPTPVWSDAEIPSLPLPSIPSPSLPVSPPLPVSSPVPPGRIYFPFTTITTILHTLLSFTSYLLPLPPPLHLLSTDRREDRPDVTLPPRKRLGIALGPAYEVGESLSATAARPAGDLRADYGFVATMDREIRHDPERDVGYGITDSWDEIVETLQGAPLTRNRRAHIRFLMEAEARMSREAWVGSMDASDLARAVVMSLRTTVLAQQLQIRELQSTNRRRQTVISKMLA
ncbi:hypothetical protein Tco_1558769, partial [Tanacetum coccineum]